MALFFLMSVFFGSNRKLRQANFGSSWLMLSEMKPAGQFKIRLLSVGIVLVSLFILLQAIANFVNLSTARSADRTKEVGVRKVLGADRRSLMKQYLAESMIVAFLFQTICVHKVVVR